MKLRIDEHEIEFDTSLTGIGLILMGVGVSLIFLGEISPDHSLRQQFYNLMLLCIGVATVILVFADTHATLTKWFTIFATSGIIFLAAYLLHFPALTTLLVIPISLAIVLFGLQALMIIAFVDSLLMVGFWFFFPLDFPHSILLVTFFAIWSLATIHASFYRQVYGLGSWTVGYWKKANQIYTSAQNNQLNLEKALQNLANANQLLIQSQRRTERLRLHAENAEKSKAMFVARVSHEFRTPLNMIIGLVELMVESPRIYSMRMPPELEKDLEIVLRNCTHLATMIDDVLELTRAESGSLTLHREGVNLLDIVNEACQVVSPLIKKKNLDLEIQMPANLPEIYCDRTRIRQVILNLVSNAARFTISGKIIVRLQLTGELILVSITDTGPGIAPEYAEKIFEPFYQGMDENTWKEKGGSGLGLTISKQFVELHGGQMWLKSQVGLGSTFFFTLPIQMRSEFSSQPGRWIQPDWIWHEEDFKASRLENAEKMIKPRILILDETQGLLSQFEHYSDPFTLIICQDTNDLSQQAQENQPDLIWINLQHPENLLSLSTELNRLCPGIPVAGSLISASNSQFETSQHLNYLTKPITLTRLQESLHTILPSLKRVLIVDDDPDVQDLLSRMLSVIDPHIQTTRFSNGEEAISYLAQNSPPDLLLLDVYMPGQNGFEVLDQLRRNEKTALLPVLLISAQDLANRQSTSPGFYFAIEEGLPLKRLIESSIRLANLLPSTGTKPDLTPAQIVGA